MFDSPGSNDPGDFLSEPRLVDHRFCISADEWERQGPLVRTLEVGRDQFEIEVTGSQSLEVRFTNRNSLLASSCYKVRVSLEDITWGPRTMRFGPDQVSHTATLPVDRAKIRPESRFFDNGYIVLLISIEEVEQEMPLRQTSWEDIPPFVERVPYVGLKNQGATCYMNSILQMLFHLPIFRKVIYQMDERSSKADSENIPMNLQNLFAQLQTSKSAVSTEALTRSFGWSDTQVIVQQDAQEFCRQLLDNIREKLKGTDQENMIQYIFGGKTQIAVHGLEKDFTVKREEEFYDVSLSINNCSSVPDSFDLFVSPESLVGDNRYESQEYGLQDAELTTRFLTCPRVLMIHLKRFEFDQLSQSNEKLNYLYMFEDKLSMKEYLSSDADPDTPSDYELFGVLVHSGTTKSGHYYSFLRTSPSPQWYKFNDSRVEEAKSAEAIDENWGGENDMDGIMPYPKNYSAYLLVYVLQNSISEVYQPVPDSCIPDRIMDRVAFAELVRNDRTFYLYTDVDIQNNVMKGRLFFDYDSIDARSFMCRDSESLEDLYNKVRAVLQRDQILLWTTTMYGIEALVQSDSHSKISSLGEYNRLFVSSARPRDDEIMVFVYLYDWRSKHPLMFLETCFVARYALVSRLHTSHDGSMIISRATIGPNSVVLTRLDPSVSFGENWVTNGSMIVMEPDWTKNSESSMVSDEAIKDDLTCVNYFDIMGYPETAATYLSCIDEMAEVQIKCLGDRIKFISLPPTHVQWRNFYEVVLKAYGRKEPDVLFWRDGELLSMKVDPEDLVSQALPGFQKIVTAVFIHIPPDLDLRWTRLEIQLCVNSSGIEATVEELFTDEPDVATIQSRVFEKYSATFGEETPLRLVTTDGYRITSIVSDDMTVTELSNPVRLERIPESQIGKPVSDLYFVSFNGFPGKIPLVLAKIPNETVRALKARIFSEFGIESGTITLSANMCERWCQEKDEVPKEINMIEVRKPPQTSRSLGVTLYN